jgi:hypothetical protein
VPNKRILIDQAQAISAIKKKQVGLGNQVQIPLFDSDRNAFYD